MKWVNTYQDESQKALHYIGKYRVANEFVDFRRTPEVWNRYSATKKEEVINAFNKFVPRSYQYEKPKSAGYKPNAGKQKRRARLPDPEMFKERIDVAMERPAKLPREDGNVIDDADLDIDSAFNPDRKTSVRYDLVHRSDTKNCPKKVTVCNSCPIPYGPQDIALVRTTGTREFTTKSGKEKQVSGNIYMHFLDKCLKKQNKDFTYNFIRVPKKTQELCGPNVIASFKKRGMIID